jgi:hypothetical protein
MIYTNIPDYSDYKKKADELLMVGFYQLFDLKFNQNNLNFRYDQKLSICNSNLQQCCELYLKYLLCKVSPYLLIRETVEKDTKSNLEKATAIFYKNLETSISILDEFNKLSKQEKDFTNCFTIDSEKLFSLSVNIYGSDFFISKYNFNFIEFYKNNRNTRNFFMHSHSSNSIDYNDLLISYLAIFDIFNKKNLIKFIYKDMLKQHFHPINNPISRPFYSLSVKNSKPHGAFPTHKKGSPFCPDISINKKMFTAYIRYSIMRISELIFNCLNPADLKVFFLFYSDFKKSDNSFYCPYCEDYYRAYKEDRQSIFSDKNSTTLYSIASNVNNNFNYDGFFKSFYPINKGGFSCKCIICGRQEDVVDKKNCHNCKQCLLPESYVLNNKCLTCGCSQRY